MKPGLRDLQWMAAGAVLLLGTMLVVLNVPHGQSLTERFALKARKVELVDQMRLSLASASEAEKSAVLATTDQDSRTYAGQARAATAALREQRDRLDKLLESGDNTREKELLAEFSKAFVDFERIDKELLGLAVQDTNLKAYALAFGPAADALRDMDDALAQIVKSSANSVSSDDEKIIVLADGAQISALRILALLPPHIAEASDQRMDEMEAQMGREDREIRKDLADLARFAGLAENADLATATDCYAGFGSIRVQILKLSRENTNVRSQAISLIQKRKAMFLCQDELAALQQAIDQEAIAGETVRTPVSPR